jgi:fluoride ion exporter CrcB/FEX
MRNDGSVVVVGLFVLAIIGAIFDGIFDAGRWLFSQWHWLQLFGPVVLGFILVIARLDLIEKLPDRFWKVWVGTGTIGALVFTVAWMATEGAVWDFVTRLPLWLTASALSLLYCPVAVVTGLDSLIADQNKRERWDRLLKEKRREPFGGAGKTSDEKLRDLGMI